ncbi:MAG: dockerin type I repeat-containing protein [Eubacteriales bacterium]|nr:dockerin type I repeat-containing protein [Eubacteriales bacterium]
MKKIKRITSFLLALLMACLFSVSAFAENSEQHSDDVYKMADEVMHYANNYYDTFRLVDEVDFDYTNLECDKESSSELLSVYNEVEDYWFEIFDEIRIPQVDEINDFYTRLDEAALKVVLLRKELKYLIDFCSLEDNTNSYYSEDVWIPFEASLAKAFEVYDKGVEGIEVSYAYWDLKFALNKLCASNSIPGDVDNNGRLSVFDATLVQQNVAKMCTFNASQLTVLNVYFNEEVSILDATKLQRAVAKTEKFVSHYLIELSSGEDIMSLEDNWVFLTYREFEFRGLR